MVEWELEHVNPLCLGGLHALDNLEIACPDCNREKAGFTLDDLFGPERAADIRLAVPDLSASTGRAIELIWDGGTSSDSRRRRALAKAVSRRPRRGLDVVSVDDQLDREVFNILLNPENPWQAVPLRTIQEERIKLGQAKNLDDGNLRQRWDLMMGMSSSESRRATWDIRYMSRRIVPLKLERKKAFGIHRDAELL